MPFLPQHSQFILAWERHQVVAVIVVITTTPAAVAASSIMNNQQQQQQQQQHPDSKVPQLIHVITISKFIEIL